MIFRFTPEADAELTEARRWYSHHRKDLDLEFMECIEDALARILSNPYLFPVVHGSLRRTVVRRFRSQSSIKSPQTSFRSLQSFIRVASRRLEVAGELSALSFESDFTLRLSNFR